MAFLMLFKFELQSRFNYFLQKELSEVTTILSCSSLENTPEKKHGDTDSGPDNVNQQRGEV